MPLPKAISVPSQYQDSVQQLQRRQAIANMLSQQGSAPIETRTSGTGAYPVAVRTSPLEVISKLASTYAANRINNDVDQRYSQIAQQMGAEQGAAAQDLENSVPADEVGAEALNRIRNAPDNALINPVSDRASALMRATNAGIDPSVIAALTKKPEGYNLSAGQTRFDARNQPIASVAEKTPEDFVDYVDAGDKRNPVSHRTGAPIAGLPAMQKGMTPAGAAADAKRSVGFSDDASALLASLASKGISLPAGMRSKDQQVSTLNGLLAKYPGMAPDDIAEKIAGGQITFGAAKKETQIAAGQAGKVAVAANELKTFGDQVLEASAAVPRGNFIPLSKLLQMKDSSISDPALLRFKAKMQALNSAYDQLAARGGTDQDKRAHIHELFQTAAGPEAVQALVQALREESDGALAAAAKAQEYHPAGSAAGAPGDDALLKKWGG